MNVEEFQQRVMAQVGACPTEALLNDALSGLAREATAMQTLVSLNHDGEQITDEDLVGLVGDLLLRVAIVGGTLAVDLEHSMAWAVRAAEARSAPVAAPFGVDARLVSVKGVD